MFLLLHRVKYRIRYRWVTALSFRYRYRFKCERYPTLALTLRLHGLAQPSSGGGQQCADAFSAAQTGRSEQHRELIRAQIEIRTEPGLQQTVERRQTHRPATHTHRTSVRDTQASVYMHACRDMGLIYHNHLWYLLW